MNDKVKEVFNKTNIEKVKSRLNKKVLLGGLALLMCFLLIIVCSFSSLIIDPKGWQNASFWTDELIILAIVILSMVCFIFISQSSNAQNANSKIAKSRALFFVSAKKIEDSGVNNFRQRIKAVLQPEDLKTIKARKLREIGITDLLVLELDNVQLLELTKAPQKFAIPSAENEEDRKGRYFKRISEDQYNAILKIRKNDLKIKFVEPEYYLSASKLTDVRTISERAVNEDKRKSLFMFISIISKVGATVISAMIFASLIKDTVENVEQATAWAKFFSRMWAMLSSGFMGYIVGVQLNDIDAEYVDMKLQVHTRYLQDTDFKPLTEQEEAKQEFINRLKEEQVLHLDNKSNRIEMKNGSI